MFIAKLSSITGIESLENQNGISVYPNPSTGKVVVAVAGGNPFPSGGLGFRNLQCNGRENLYLITYSPLQLERGRG